MESKTSNNTQKSLMQRFLFIMGILFLVVYIILGLIFIIWKDMPYFTLPYTNRLAFGIVLIIYSIIRFFRIIKKEP